MPDSITRVTAGPPPSALCMRNAEAENKLIDPSL